jgi:hypothetical protein
MKTFSTARACKAFFLVVLFFAWTAAGQVLNVPQKYQEKDQWCWAASTQAILAYYGRNYTQTTIAQYGTGGINTWSYCSGSGTEGGIYRRGCDLILNYFGGIQSQSYSSSLSQSTCQNEIAGGRPVFINWYYSAGGGHFVVLKGLNGSTATLMDPWNGPTVNTFNWVVLGGDHSWNYSLRLTTSPLWVGAVDLGSGWKWLNWFGYFSPMSNGWIWHKQFGFICCTGSDANLWMYIKDQAEWWWTTSAIYPNMYRARDNAWLFYQRNFDAAVADWRWFYNYTTKRWVYY